MPPRPASAPASRPWRAYAVAAADLLLGSTCAGCGSPELLLCPACAEAVLPDVGVRRPSPPPRVLAPGSGLAPVSAGVYAGVLREVLLAYKERRRDRLLGPLAALLRPAVAESVRRAGGADDGARDRWVLVPMPSRGSAVRARGYDAVGLLAGRAARDLRREGEDVVAGRLLRHRVRVQDQAGLDAAERAANLRGALRSGRPPERRRCLVVDDVVTTGASLGEAVRALREAGADVAGVATVAATPRSLPSRPPAQYGA